MINLSLGVAEAILGGVGRALRLPSAPDSSPASSSGAIVRDELIARFQRVSRLKQRILEAADRVPSSFSPINE
jgi:hypothetical protein